MTQDLDEKGTFKVLFEGNRSALGAEEGGCLRLPQPWMWSQFLEAHLTGEGEPVGVYPMVSGDRISGFHEDAGAWAVKWGCVDIDVGESESQLHAKNLHLALEAFGIRGWIERSRSKGYHVWVFADSWVPAGTMRSALLAACQIAGAPSQEVNPKQAKLREGQLGNYVRLPYPGWLGPATSRPPFRRVMLRPSTGVPYGLSEFVCCAFGSRVGGNTLRTLSEAYVAPERPIQRREWKGVPTQDEGILGYVRWVENQQEGNRNMGLFWAACRALDQGIYDLEPLVQAGVSSGLPEWEARRTVESAESLY
jgi:hypothetical protein